MPPLLTTRDVLRFATINGAKALRLDSKTGSLTPGKEADIIILDASAINVAPLNHVPGAVVSLMDRTNVETVIVAGKVRKWKGRLLDVDLPRLRTQLEDSRDYIFARAGIPQDLFRPTERCGRPGAASRPCCAHATVSRPRRQSFVPGFGRHARRGTLSNVGGAPGMSRWSCAGAHATRRRNDPARHRADVCICAREEGIGGAHHVQDGPLGTSVRWASTKYLSAQLS